MSCDGTPGVKRTNYTSDSFTAPSSSITVKVGGNPVAADVFGTGPYTFKIDGPDVICPGPIEAFDADGNRVYCAKITGC